MMCSFVVLPTGSSTVTEVLEFYVSKMPVILFRLLAVIAVVSTWHIGSYSVVFAAAAQHT